MLTAISGTTSRLVFGAADFLGGLAARRLSAVLTTAIAAVPGLVVFSVALPFLGGSWSSDAVVLGAASGVAGAIAIGLLYACLAIGPMSIPSPLTAVVSAIVPLTYGLIGGERLGPIGYVALAIALVAIVLVGFVPEKNAVRPNLPGVLMAIGSGIAIGVFLILIDATPDESGLVPLFVNRVTNSTITFALVGVLARIAWRGRSGRAHGEWRSGLALAVGCGCSTPSPTPDCYSACAWVS